MSTDAGMPTGETQSQTPPNEFAPIGEPQNTEPAATPAEGGEGSNTSLAEQVAAAQGEQPKAPDASSESQSGTPEQYEAFNLKEGWTIAEDDLNAFTDIARGLDLDQAGAQKLVDLFVGIEEARNTGLTQLAEQQEAARDAEWQEQLANDPEIGGDKFPAAQANIVALEQSGVLHDEFVSYLSESGEFKNPVMIKQLASLGAMLQEDPARGGESGAQGDGKTPAQRMFANSGHQ